MWMKRAVPNGAVNGLQDTFADMLTLQGWPDDAAMFCLTGSSDETTLFLTPAVPESVRKSLGNGWRPTDFDAGIPLTLLAGHAGVEERLGVKLGC